MAESFPPLTRYWPNLGSCSAPQAGFLLLDQLEAFYGGAAGGGKSDALLAAALQYVDVPGYAALILRRTFRQLDQPDAIMFRSKEWLHATDAKWNDDGKRWTFPSTATLTFGYLEHENDIYNYQGPAFHYIGWDELTQFSERQYTYLFSRTRRRKALQELGVPIRHRSASNPGGIGHGWVHRRFIDPEQKHAGAVFIPAKVADNPGLDVAEYEKSLAELDDTLRAQLLHGDWGVFEGAAFGNFNQRLHVVEPFPIPTAWSRFESMDFGVANPSCVLAWAADYDGNLIVFDSYYSQPNTLVSAQASAIVAKRALWWPVDRKGWPVHSTVCYADPSMWARHSGQNKLGAQATDVTELAEHGVSYLTQANNRRRPGRLRLLELLKPDPNHAFPGWHPRAGERGSPRLFIFKGRAPELVEQLAAAPTNDKPEGGEHGVGEVVQGAWESQHGHSVAAARYGAMSWQPATVKPRQLPADPRRAAVVLLVEQEQTDEELDDLGVEWVDDRLSA